MSARVALVGASGYTGVEALRLILQHPAMALTMLCAGRRAGEPMARVAPAFTGLDLPQLVPFDADAVAQAADFAFLALPHGTAQDAAAALLARGVRVIDLSADHRFDDAAFYGSIYGAHAHPESPQRRAVRDVVAPLLQPGAHLVHAAKGTALCLRAAIAQLKQMVKL